MIGVSSKEIEELLTTPIPEVLWHYTSLDALKGIVEFKKIWASDIRFLNDSEEYRHAVDLLREEVDAIDDGHLRELTADLIVEEFRTGFLSSTSMPLFVASFSAAKDLLSQWRAYTEVTKGVSLGFDLREIRPETQHLVIFAPCVYDEQRKRALIRSALQELMKCVRDIRDAVAASFQISQRFPAEVWEKLTPNMADNEISKMSGDFGRAAKRAIYNLVPVMSLLKHPSFAEEQEWRLVIHANPEKLGPSSDKKIRVGKASLIPYIDFDLPRDKNANLPTLTELLIGPNPIMERSILAARTLLE
jgi:hypothetical protein